MSVRHVKDFHGFRFVLLVFSILFYAWNFCEISATGNDSFITENIDIRRQDTDPLTAKREALNDSLREAFSRALFKNFSTSDEDIDFTDDEISSCLHDYSIKAEKYSASFYIASISYRFNKKAIAELLEKTETKSETSYPQRRYEKSIKVAMYSIDFIENYAEIKKINYRVEKFSNNFVVLILKDNEIPLLRKLSVKYVEI